MEAFAFFDLRVCEAVRAAHCGPRRPGVSAARILLVLRGVALRAVLRGQSLGDGEAAMLERFLSRRGLMAIETVDPFRGVLAALELDDDRRGLAPMTLGALTRRFDERCARL